MGNWYIRIKTNKQLDAVLCDGLDDMYDAIGCDTIQIVGTCKQSVFKQGVMMIIDDNGKLMHKDINVPATIFYAPPLDDDGMPLDFIVGDALVGVLNDARDDVIGFDSMDEALDFGVGLFRVIGADVIY